MTTLELRIQESLRDHVRRVRRMRQDGILVAARQALLAAETGDLVQFVPLGDKRWLVALVDAKARGPKGAEIARDVARLFAARAHTTRRLGDLLDAANDLVHEAAAGEELVSVALFVLDGARRTIRMANAGQVAPLAVGRSGGVVALEGHGPALGLLPDVEYHEAGPLRLAPGMIVLATTDGVHDAVDREGHPFGREGSSRALAAVRDHGPRAVVRRTIADVARHGAPDEADDRTALAFGFSG
jgi:sigma-B regulation protein RsbU (phosphoserine phosphatase)